MPIPDVPALITVPDLGGDGTIPSGYVLLDIREDDEWAAGHAPGALHLPLSQLLGRLGELPNGRLLVICRSGNRSARLCDWLNRNGYAAWDVGGGMQSWAAAGWKVVRDDGAPGRII